MKRVVSIDVFRGITMFLMIWVNDFWTLQDIPKWLKHAASGEDYLGFSDLNFPWFLFVMGVSRRRKMKYYPSSWMLGNYCLADWMKKIGSGDGLGLIFKFI